MIPKKKLARFEVLNFISKNEFKEKEFYTEREVNEKILKYHKDFAFIRRLLIENKIMGREKDGSKYFIM